ncbi:MAG: PQQ-binding-like beta-propeller repeat protein [Acidobacteriia bacterium]|nr:PQQ-binding-like beta-propeller repeat protein [Terriglobia bacterium]
MSATYSAEDTTSGVASVTPPVTVTTEGANQAVTGTATDHAGNTATTSLTLNIDKTPPGVVISAPADGAFRNTSSLTVTGTATDALSGIEAVACHGAPASFSGTEFSCPVSLLAGSNPIMVEATDRAGNSSSATLTVTLDSAPPSLVITSPANGATFSASPITVTGTATDELSAVGSVTCNNAPAVLTGSDFTCEIGLAEGSNSIAVRATDGVGNVATQSLSVTLSTMPGPPPNCIEITPSTLALVVDEPRQLGLVDDYGRQVPGASWSVSDPSVAELTTDGQIVLTGKGVGWVMITATWGNLTAEAQASVYEGPELPQGTIRWSGQPAPGYSTTHLVQAQPAENMPDIYSREEDGSGSLIVRARASDGRQLWRKPVGSGAATVQAAAATSSATATSQSAGLQELDKAVGDSLGGLLLQGYDYDWYSQIVRIDGAAGEVSWRYSSPGWFYDDWALHPDGTIFVVENIPEMQESGYPYATQMLAIDGTNGQLKYRVRLPNSTFYGVHNSCPHPDSFEYVDDPLVGPPMLAPNGSAYVEVATSDWIETVTSTCDSYGNWGGQPMTWSVYRDASLKLLELRPDGSPQWRTVKQDHYEGPAEAEPPKVGWRAGEVIPDGDGGLLATWLSLDFPYGSPKEARMTRVTDSGQADYTIPYAQSPDDDSWWWYIPEDRSLVLGENGVAFATNGMRVVSFDVASGAVRWTWETDASLEMIAATAGNGLVLKIPAEAGTERVVRLDPTGQAAYDDWTGNSIQYAYGDMWLTQGSAEAVSAPAILWPFSIWSKPGQDDIRAPQAVVQLQVHKVDGTLWMSGSSVVDRMSEAIGFWARKAGILFTLVPPILTVDGCDLQAHPAECPGPQYDITSIANDGNPVNGGWLEVYRRFCGTPVITATAQRSYCQPQGSQLLLTGDVGARGTDFGATPALGVPPTPINLSALADLAEGMTVAHELGHQLGLPHCNINTVAVPQDPSLFFGSPPFDPSFFYNLMYSGLLGPPQPFSWSTLNPAQIARARARARKWAGE